jgi:8-amino-7-oxononanoate synthase
MSPAVLTETADAPAKDLGETWISEWAAVQKLKAPSIKGSSVFYRNLEEELDLARTTGHSLPLHVHSHEIDFSSCDVLSLGSSGALREEFLKELADHPDFQLGAGGSRLMDGHSSYQDTVEREVADYFGVESALILHSGWTANQAIFSTIPRSGDVIVYDELMHATALAGMKLSLALEQRVFRHNDLDAFIEVLEEVRDSQPQVRNGKRSVIIAVESYYSMDGDYCPLEQMIEAAEEIFPHGNAQFVVDEAHSFGVIGPQGKGFVAELGLEDKVAMRMMTFGKSLAGSGGK